MTKDVQNDRFMEKFRLEGLRSCRSVLLQGGLSWKACWFAAIHAVRNPAMSWPIKPIPI